MTNGKGDKRRTSEDVDKYRDSHDRIFGDSSAPNDEEADTKD